MRGLVGRGPEGHKQSTLKARALCALLFIITGGAAVLWAQEPVAVPASTATRPAPAPEANVVRLLVGRSTVLDVGRDIARVSLTSADIADALVTSPNQLLINGKQPGTISMFVWDRGNSLMRYEVVVQRDLAILSEQMRELFPGERIDVQSNGRNVVLSGLVSNKDIVEKAVSVAAGYVENKDEVVTLLQLQPNAPSNQVLLRVRFAEVSRNGLTELGASFAANGYDGRWFGRSTTGQFPAPEWDQEGRFVFSDFLNLFLFDSEKQIAGVVRALQNRGLFQSLAEPNLVAESGKEASFLAGGEFPIPVVQGTGANLGISVVFKEFGIRLNFTPTVNNGRVHLKVRPEVSTLDFNNAVILNGFRIPALSTRRTETELELGDGQTFAIAGLINNEMRSTFSRIPGIGHIPILGLLFSSKAAQKDQTELVVMITPQILPNNSRGVTPDLPRLQERFLDPLPPNRTQEPPPPAFGSTLPTGAPGAPASNATAAPAGTPAPGATLVAAPGSAPAPADAAAAVSALTPASPRPVGPVTTPVVPDPQPPAAQIAPPAPRPLTRDERRALERVHREQQKRAEEAEKAAKLEREEALKREAEERKRQEKLAQEEQKRQEQLAREQARRDAEAARRAQDEARRLAEAERRRQEAIAEAEAKLKAAEEAYQAELNRRNP